MQADMTAYYKSLGKTFADFKTVIPLDWMIGGAKVLPKIIEDEEYEPLRRQPGACQADRPDR
jgi:hypothetical protein